MTQSVKLKDVISFLLQPDDHLYGYSERHSLAYQLLIEFRASVSLCDQVMDTYLEYIKKQSGYNVPMHAMQHAYSLRDNVSANKVEALLKEFVRFGWHSYATDLAESVNRKLTNEEVLALVEYYENGAQRSDEKEEELLNLARNIGGQALTKKTKEAFVRQKERDKMTTF